LAKGLPAELHSLQASPIPEHDAVPDSQACPSPHAPPLLPQGEVATNDNISLRVPNPRSVQARVIEQTGDSQGHSLSTHPSADSIHEQLSLGPPEQSTSEISRVIKEESKDVCIDTALNAPSSQTSSRSSLGKRRRSRLGEFFIPPDEIMFEILLPFSLSAEQEA
jgi:hypothetical protein